MLDEVTANLKNNLFDGMTVEILSKRKEVYPAKLEFDNSNMLIKLILVKNGLHLEIKYSDLIGFNRLNKSVIRNTTSSDNNEALRLSFFPVYTFSECNLCGICCCKCKNYVKRRVFRDTEIIVPESIIQEVYFNLLKITNISKISNEQKILTIPKKRLLLYINPIGGRGKAADAWDEVENIFRKYNRLNSIEYV